MLDTPLILNDFINIIIIYKNNRWPISVHKSFTNYDLLYNLLEKYNFVFDKENKIAIFRYHGLRVYSLIISNIKNGDKLDLEIYPSEDDKINNNHIFQIFYQVKRKTIALVVHPYLSVLDLKSLIEEKEGLPSKFQILKNGYKYFHYDKRLADYNVQLNSTIFVIYKYF